MVSNLESERVDPPMLNLTFAGTSGARFVFCLLYMGVSENFGTPTWMVYKGKPPLELMIWRYPYFWKHPYTHVGQIYQRISCMSSRSPAEPYSARLWTDSLFWNNVVAQLSHVILRMTQSDVFR